jgi:hypothetical protein
VETSPAVHAAVSASIILDRNMKHKRRFDELGEAERRGVHSLEELRGSAARKMGGTAR